MHYLPSLNNKGSSSKWCLTRLIIKFLLILPLYIWFHIRYLHQNSNAKTFKQSSRKSFDLHTVCLTYIMQTNVYMNLFYIYILCCLWHIMHLISIQICEIQICLLYAIGKLYCVLIAKILVVRDCSKLWILFLMFCFYVSFKYNKSYHCIKMNSELFCC